MKVSIITITYNAEEFLEKTILSIVTQSCSCFEYIIIDGKSSDSTLEIVKKYEEKISNGEFSSISINDFCWISEKDNGLYDAMNKGLDRATGDFVWFINAGDKIYKENTLQAIIDAYNKKPNSEIIYGQAIVIDKDDNVLGERHKITPPKLKFISLLNGLLVCHQSILVKKSIASHYDIKYKISADYDWVCKAVSASKENCYIDNYISRFMTAGVSNTHRKQGLKERFFIMRQHFGLLRTLMAHITIIIRYPFTTKYN